MISSFIARFLPNSELNNLEINTKIVKIDKSIMLASFLGGNLGPFFRGVKSNQYLDLFSVGRYMQGGGGESFLQNGY